MGSWRSVGSLGIGGHRVLKGCGVVEGCGGLLRYGIWDMGSWRSVGSPWDRGT